MIGFYDYTVVMTYFSLAFSIFGMTQAMSGRFKIAIFCLAMSGLCDMFDGKIARTKKNRTEDEKMFGIQLDSLCDVVCFGVFPTMICYLLGVRGKLGITLIIFYAIAAVIRLAYFNVLEGKEQLPLQEGEAKYYHGLPITSIAVILPMTFLAEFFVSERAFITILHIVLFAVGMLFIVDFKFQKPNNKTCALLVIMTGSVVILIILLTGYRLPQLRAKLNYNSSNVEFSVTDTTEITGVK